MATITIGANEYDTYEDLATADAYADGAANADDYRAADTDTRSRAVVSGTRVIDRQQWQGQPTVEGQPHAFPRTGLIYPDGSPVDSASVPLQVIEANSEIAIAIVGGSAVQDQTSTDPNTRRLKAGSVEIEYFRNLPQGLRLPLPAQELIGLWLAGSASALALSDASGTCGRSAFTHPEDFTESF